MFQRSQDKIGSKPMATRTPQGNPNAIIISTQRCSVRLKSGFCAGYLNSFTSTLANYAFTKLAMDTVSQFQKGNCTATKYNDILDNCVLPTF